jgi:flagellin
MSTAKSRIKDVDFATESSKYAQAKILEQSSIAMLAQANLKPEIALSLI